ncbi:small ubiquitin-related modifier 2-like [Nycticebus coucang]|uniref:small ubiquitin-related modifier 2-like n=1 Tax=Nycticebus coucang TaxID=9470 RepID=UPI00234D33F7|nr:small ubiquitin-related modifier 2-like [Nycticebus coucang]
MAANTNSYSSKRVARLHPINAVWTWGLFCDVAAEKTGALATADEKPKEGVKTENNDHINLKVAGQDGSAVQFKMKRHTPLSKLMEEYCDDRLEIQDEDTIGMFQQQTGGVYSRGNQLLHSRTLFS